MTSQKQTGQILITMCNIYILLSILLNYLQRMPNNVELERHDGAVFWGMGSQLSRAVADIEAGGSVLAFLQAALQVASLELPGRGCRASPRRG